MSATYRLFSLWTAKKGIRTAMAGCEELGVSRTAATLWKSGRNASPSIIDRMAREIGDDPQGWLALVESEKTTGEDQRAWLRIAKEFGKAAAIALIAFLPAGAKASTRLDVYTSIQAATAESRIVDISSTHYTYPCICASDGA